LGVEFRLFVEAFEEDAREVGAFIERKLEQLRFE
jgi:hypothetical protein